MSIRGDAVVAQERWTFRLRATFGHQEVTGRVEELVQASGVQSGVAVVAVVGSTGAVTTIEYESGALADLEAALGRMAPESGEYEHNERWGDGNGYSHVRSALLKTGISVPVVDGRLALGTWQQIVVINLDNRERDRVVTAMVMGVGRGGSSGGRGDA